MSCFPLSIYNLFPASLSLKSFTKTSLKGRGELNLGIQLCNTKSNTSPVSPVEMQNLG